MQNAVGGNPSNAEVVWHLGVPALDDAGAPALGDSKAPAETDARGLVSLGDCAVPRGGALAKG